jgi:hypothetical protein
MKGSEMSTSTCRPKPTLSFELISPTKACELLSTLDPREERKLRERVVAKYARDMREGRWQLAGEPILIDVDGKLAGNGQHRLWAVIEADVAVELPVMRNATDAQRTVVDQGARRTFADVLKIEFGEVSTHVLAAAVRQVRQFRESGQFGLTGQADVANPTIAELIETYQAEPNLSTSLGPSRRAMEGIRASHGLVMACHYVFSEIDPDEAEEFFRRLGDGAGLEKYDAIWHLRRYFSSDDRPRQQKVQSAVLIKAFNLWRLGEKPQLLRWRGGGARPERYPTINPPL